MLSKQIVYVTGLPRSGSTLICQLLGMHEDVYSIGHSSPLASILEHFRTNISGNPFLLGQLDVDFDLTYNRLKNALKGLINGWFEETDKNIVVDKNRAWLGMVQTVSSLDNGYKMIVCIRDLIQLYGSIDTQHKNTILLSFADNTSNNSSWYRADTLFTPTGVIGGPIRAIENLQDIGPGFNTLNNIYFMQYEKLILDTENELNKICTFLSIKNKINSTNMIVKPHETDSYYRFKFRHNTHNKINKLNQHEVPPRISFEIFQKFRWYFDHFYPRAYEQYKSMPPTKTVFGAGRNE